MTQNTLVIVGIGDVVDRFYIKALEKLKKARKLTDVQICFVDNTSLWSSSSTVNRRRTTLARIQRNGWEFVDRGVATGEGRFKQLIKTKAQVIVATPDRDHIDTVQRWLKGNCIRIVVEKPLSNDIKKVKKLTSLGPAYYKRVFAFDHYRAKVHFAFNDPRFLEAILHDDLKDPFLMRMRFFCIEDFSGTHETFLNEEKKQSRILPGRNGPIEIQGRETTLWEGITFDLMAHMLGILEYFGTAESIRILRAKAGKYRGVDFNYHSEAEIPNETFAQLDFKFEGDKGNIIDGQAFLGKGFRGIKRPESPMVKLLADPIHSYPKDQSRILADLYHGEVKLIEFEAKSGRKVQFFLKKGKKVVMDKRGKLKISDFAMKDPHEYMLEWILSVPEEPYAGDFMNDLFLTVDEAMVILEKLKEARSQVDRPLTIPYFLGYRKGQKASGDVIRFPEYLDHVLEHASNAHKV